MKIIGIDPGITGTGYSLVADGTCIDIGTIRAKGTDPHLKVLEICTRIKQIVDKQQPEFAALEKVFYHKNIKTLIRASELRGAIILALLESGIAIKEYTATEIKLTTTGNGRASKEQVRYFIERVFADRKHGDSSHAIDAAAIAYTAIQKMSRRI